MYNKITATIVMENDKQHVTLKVQALEITISENMNEIVLKKCKIVNKVIE